ncbi:MAG: hypothetical protein IJU66_00135 [Oscillospiraceae bacterium]|nr:hypothetical protein [Oscillospiraceae bacterium]
MQLLEDGILAALAAVGLMTLLLLPISALKRPRGGESRAVTVIPCRDGAAGIEHTVRAQQRARQYGGARRIVLLDRGMDEEARTAALLLCRDDPDVVIRDKETFWNEWE